MHENEVRFLYANTLPIFSQMRFRVVQFWLQLSGGCGGGTALGQGACYIRDAPMFSPWSVSVPPLH